MAAHQMKLNPNKTELQFIPEATSPLLGLMGTEATPHLLALTGSEAISPLLALMGTEATPPFLGLTGGHTSFTGTDGHRGHTSFTGTNGHRGHTSFMALTGSEAISPLLALMGKEVTPPFLGLTGTEATSSLLGLMGTEVTPPLLRLMVKEAMSPLLLLMGTEATPPLLALTDTETLAFGTLYPAYSSYKAVKTKNVKEYETRWKGSKARSIGAGFKLFYYGVDSKRNGVGVVLKEEFVRNVLEVKRVSDRVMSLKLEIEGVMLNVVSGYAPQVGCELEEKERFWSELDEVTESIPTGERVVIGADFNGHVGEGNRGDEEVMGKFGVRERNLEGQMVVDFAKRMDMAVVNTYFQKREEHRVTYKSGGRSTQVDYILCRRGNLKEISDCKVVVGESVARQHRMVVMTLMVCKKKKRSEIEKKTKWWKLKKEECCEEFRQKLRQALGGQVVLPDDWETTAEVIRETGRKVKWMMYWIVFALFTTAETITDMLLSWFPFYFELKIAFVIWLLSPYTKGSSVLYRKFVHPMLSNKEKEIDEYITQAKDRSYETMMRFGKRGLNIAATAAVTAATKGQGVLSEKLRSFSLQDLTLIQNEEELMDDTHTAATLPRAKTRTVRPTSISTDTESQLSSRSDIDQSDGRMEHSDEDAADKVPKRTASMRAAKKPTTAKTETVKTLKKQPKKKNTTATSNNAETPP
ncbi:hypothetical protein QTP86_032451 [Hemibagrus guttatus]|nr:hypothetical protein QTP86_032451 [Hemibagrus guttatus]